VVWIVLDFDLHDMNLTHFASLCLGHVPLPFRKSCNIISSLTPCTPLFPSFLIIIITIIPLLLHLLHQDISANEGDFNDGHNR
jgi:hypothetical protein